MMMTMHDKILIAYHLRFVRKKQMHQTALVLYGVGAQLLIVSFRADYNR